MNELEAHQAIEAQRQPVGLVHDDSIEWPNMLGFTPCTRQYADLHQRVQEAAPDFLMGETLDDLPPERYEAYCRLEHALGVLQLEGHLLKGERY